MIFSDPSKQYTLLKSILTLNTILDNILFFQWSRLAIIYNPIVLFHFSNFSILILKHLKSLSDTVLIHYFTLQPLSYHGILKFSTNLYNFDHYQAMNYLRALMKNLMLVLAHFLLNIHTTLFLFEIIQIITKNLKIMILLFLKLI